MHWISFLLMFIFIYLLIFGCAGSSLLWRLFSCCSPWGPLFHFSAQASLAAEHRLYGVHTSVVEAVATAAKSLQSCPTLCDPIDGSPPGSPVHGILQARTPEWVAISFSNAWQWKVKVKSLGRVWLLATPWTAAHQAPPSMGFSRQEYWSGCHSWAQ